MTLNDLDFMVESCVISCDQQLAEIDAVSSYVERARSIETRKNALQSLCESATDEEFMLYEESSDEGFISKIKSGITKACNAVKKFIADVISKIQSFFRDRKAKRSMAKLDAALKANPKLKGKKVKTRKPDLSEYDKTDKALAKAQQKMASGAGTEEDANFIDRALAKIREHKVAAIAVTVTVAALMTTLSAILVHVKKSDSEASQKEKETNNFIAKAATSLKKIGGNLKRDAKNVGSAVGNTTYISKIAHAGRTRLALVKDKVQNLMSWFSLSTQAIWSGIRGEAFDNSFIQNSTNQGKLINNMRKLSYDAGYRSGTVNGTINANARNARQRQTDTNNALISGYKQGSREAYSAGYEKGYRRSLNNHKKEIFGKESAMDDEFDLYDDNLGYYDESPNEIDALLSDIYNETFDDSSIYDNDTDETAYEDTFESMADIVDEYDESDEFGF